MRLAKLLPIRRLRTLARDRSGNFATMTAIVAPVGIALAAVAVDSAALYLERREAQAATDIAAIAAAANLADPKAAALAALSDNGVADVRVITRDELRAGALPSNANLPAMLVVTGRYSPDPAIPVDERFEPDGRSPDAVQVTLYKHGARYFSAGIIAPPRIGTRATAGTQAFAAFSIGSRLLSLQDGLLNAVLGGLTGSTLELRLMDYEALLAADIRLLDFLDALSTEADLTAATYEEMLDAEVGVGAIAGAFARMDGVSWELRNAAQRLQRDLGRSGPAVRLEKLFDLAGLDGLPVGARPAGSPSTVNAMGVLSAAAGIASGGRQVSLDLGAGLPGIIRADLRLAIGEPPQHGAAYAVGGSGEIVRTAQTRLLLDIGLGGAGGPLGAHIRLPVHVEIASGEAVLGSITCRPGDPESVEIGIDARPGIAHLAIADPASSPFEGGALRPATLVRAPLVTVSGKARAQMAETAPARLRFTHADIADGRIKSASTTNFTQSLTHSLIADLDLDVEVAGLGIGVPRGLTASVADILEAATPSVDRLLETVLSMLGLRLGEADIRVHGASCGRAVLVQ